MLSRLRLRFARPLAVAANNLDLVCCDRGLVIQLERHILDQERPHFIAESVCIEVTLNKKGATINSVSQDPASAVPHSPREVDS